MLCGFCHRAWNSIAWKCASSNNNISISHCWWTFSKFNKMQKRIVFMWGNFINFIHVFKNNISFSTIANLQITLMHKTNTLMLTLCVNLNTKPYNAMPHEHGGNLKWKFSTLSLKNSNKQLTIPNCHQMQEKTTKIWVLWKTT